MKITIVIIGLLMMGHLFGAPSSYYSPYPTKIATYLQPVPFLKKDSGIRLIDRIYVINLDERPQKWARIEPLFHDQKMNVTRASGINGWLLSEEAKKELFGPYPPQLRGGQIGCLLSHLSIIKDGYERNYSRIWIMEDDVFFLEDAKVLSSLIALLQKKDPQWDVLYTDVNMKKANGEYLENLALNPRPDQVLAPLEYYLSRIQIAPTLMKIGQRYGLHSYILSRRGMRKILDYFTHVYLWAPIDIDIHYVPSIRQYSSTRNIVTHWLGSSYSDTERAP